MFDEDYRQSLLFEDELLTNSKRYFWALQSLRLFSEQLARTIKHLPRIQRISSEFAGVPITAASLAQSQAGLDEFKELAERVERKRLEVQSLSDSVSK